MSLFAGIFSNTKYSEVQYKLKLYSWSQRRTTAREYDKRFAWVGFTNEIGLSL